jgi:hypothetical protein
MRRDVIECGEVEYRPWKCELKILRKIQYFIDSIGPLRSLPGIATADMASGHASDESRPIETLQDFPDFIVNDAV